MMTKMELMDLCFIVWRLLPREIRDTYSYDTGLLGFIRMVATLAKFDFNKLTYEELDLFIQYLT